MATDKLALLSAVELAAGSRARHFSPVEGLDAVLARIERVNPKLHAFCVVTAETARREATQAEAAIVRGERLHLNLTMQPTATVPCGFTADDLPVGLQIVGRRLVDPMVLAASAAFEAVQPWRGTRPPLA